MSVNKDTKEITSKQDGEEISSSDAKCEKDAKLYAPCPKWRNVDPEWFANQFMRPVTFGTDDQKLAEKKFQVFYIGVDEVGVGPWAGPLMSVAFWMKTRLNTICRVRDSKTIKNPVEMKQLYDRLSTDPDHKWALGTITHTEMDHVFNGNNLKARLEAMNRAVRKLQDQLRPLATARGLFPFWKLLIDGDKMPKQLESSVTQMKMIVRGDATILEISAASILAKWTRDEEMRMWAKRFPHYGFETNVGYGSSVYHQRALYKYGPCACHRRSFEPIQAFEEARDKGLPSPYDSKGKRLNKKKPKSIKTTMTGAASSAQRIERKLSCKCLPSEHVDRSRERPKSDSNWELFEWNAHTQAYKDASKNQGVAAGGATVALKMSAQINHYRYCCPLRHYDQKVGLHKPT